MADRFLIQPLSYGAAKPSGVDSLHNGLAVTEDSDQHLRDKILAVLFTNPGERVNQPQFGVGLNRAVFDGLDELTLGAIEFRLTEAIRRDIGTEIQLDRLDVGASPVEGRMLLKLRYRRRSDRVTRNLEVEI